MSEADIKLDFARSDRIGLGEAIFCAGKSVDQITEIIKQATAKDASFLFTRLAPETFAALPDAQRSALRYHALSATAVLGAQLPIIPNLPSIGVVAAGTSDAPVAYEAAQTLAFNGLRANLIVDVGVAGLHRLLDRIDELRAYKVLIAVAGMDAALVSVLGGLMSGVVIAVPTSVGYGASRSGETALGASLASCAPGIVVCNIDNGYGAACAATRIVRTFAKGA